MGQRRSAAYRFNFLGVLGFALAALAGCSGDDGSSGPAGSNAVVGGTTVNVGTLSQDELKNLSFSLADSKVTGVTISSAPVVRFTVKDSTGRGVVGLETFWSQSSPTALKGYTNLAFALAKLVPAPANTGAPSRWVSYIVTTTATPPGLTRPSTDNNGVLTGDGNGNYTYTFYRDIAQTATIVASSTDTATNKKADMGDTTYDPNLTHRLTIQIGGNVRGTGSNTPTGVQVVPGVPMQHPINLFYDFIPATGQVVSSSDETRNIVDVSACFQCHGQFTWHGGDALDGSPGTRQDTRYCVVCHTDQRKFGRKDSTVTATTVTPAAGDTSTYRLNVEGYDAYGTTPAESWGESSGLMVKLIHRIHKGEELTRTGYNFAGVLFNEVTFPQDRRNCLKCHKGPDGDNFKNVPNRAACGACHDNLNFATGENALNADPSRPNHSIQTNDANCATCHTPTAIESVHTTDNATPNNPNVPAGAVNFKYEISSVTVTATTQPVIKFRILNGTTPVVFNGTTSGTGGNVLAGYTGNPSFVVAYAMAQNGIVPAEYNNLGNAAAQPQTVSLGNLTSTDPAWTYAPTTSYGTLGVPDGSGFYTATITDAARGFPSGSTMRAVGLQGYFTQAAGTNGIAADTARHAISVVKGVTGDTQRRAIVDNAKCANCHEWLELHGGNRVYETGICVMCHVPNLSSSGRGANVANLSPAEAARLTADGYNAADPSTWPEASNNFKNLVHQIHASHKRTNEFRHVRDRGTSGVFYYNWSHITFPGILRNCETCHKAGTAGGYDGNLPAGALPTTNTTTDLNGGTTVAQDRASVPNLNDDVTLPFLATCVGCHDNAQATSHMIANGGVFTVLGPGPGATGSLGVSSLLRSAAVTQVEQCVVCHGPGRVASVTEVHARR
jgi:OmcA/MtrC family decaheme c-type cytochrome